jgi:hypothetical protein
MKAVQLHQSGRRSSSTVRLRPVRAATMLLAVAAFALCSTGCSDDDDDPAPGGGSDASGLGGFTYSANLAVGGYDSTLIIVPRGGGSSPAAPTGRMLAAQAEAGPADGLLLLGTDLRELLSGTFDPDAPSGPTLVVSGPGGPEFEGDGAPTFFTGALTVPGIGRVPDLFGPGAQEDAPLIHLLGTWEHSSLISADCGSSGRFSFECTGSTRIWKAGRSIKMDFYESCEDEPFQCELNGPALHTGTWDGLSYADTVSYSRVIEGCSVTLEGTLTAEVDSQNFSTTTTGTATFVASTCLPAGTQCELEQTLSATRCVNCWEESCATNP